MTIRKKDLETEMIQAIANQFESLFQLEFNEGLSADSVLVGLLDHGLFGEKIPPCFVSDGLAEIAEKTFKDVIEREKISKNKHDYIRYEALRDTNITRHLGIPHPESYALQALAIKKYWTEIKAHCDKPDPKVSRVHVRHVGGGRIFEMNYKGSERFDTEEQEIQWKTGAKFIAKADIATCFSSIYTHSIPWALHGRETSKENTGRNNKLPKLYGNLLDSFTQNTRDGQTNGLLIGPHASNIISEIILTCIDVDLQSKSFFKFKRHIDDYVYYAETYEDAEKFIQELVMCLRKYELTLNDKKTLILSLPRPSTENWTQQLNRFVFSKDANSETRFSTIRSFLDLALENAQTCKSSAPLNYAIKILANNQEIPPLNSRAKRLYVHEAINLALAYPYLVAPAKPLHPA